jgi:hypothetical protein
MGVTDKPHAYAKNFAPALIMLRVLLRSGVRDVGGEDIQRTGNIRSSVLQFQRDEPKSSIFDSEGLGGTREQNGGV